LRVEVLEPDHRGLSEGTELRPQSQEVSGRSTARHTRRTGLYNAGQSSPRAQSCRSRRRGRT
jgi:transposase-like protein